MQGAHRGDKSDWAVQRLLFSSPAMQISNRMDDAHRSSGRPGAGLSGAILRPGDDIQLVDLTGICQRL